LTTSYEPLSADELKEFSRKREIQALAKKVHFELFPEEYDFMMDSIADTRDRRRGVNPMNPDYTNRVNARRKKLGVPPLGPNGMAACQTSWKVAYAEAELRFPNE
jgi:hypothetical protein